ncbi:MAG: asparaginase [Rhizobiaceae bacterium]
MTHPILVEITRGSKVESVHRGAISVLDASGVTVLNIGDTEVPVFPRSAIKAIQALPVIESGAADAYGFGNQELALCCASHNGEAEHVRLARDMLSRAGLKETCLECGGHWSTRQHVLLEQTKIYDETPPAICNNCSGKHTGFVCTAAHLGIDLKGYIKPDHQIQIGINEALQDLTGAAHDQDICGTDGCSIPTYAIPLTAMALGFAKMATGNGLSRNRAKAAKRLFTACMAEPFYVAGARRFCTDFMSVGNGRLFAKTGAEGVFCGAIPELGFGIALKCDDGSARGAEAMMAAVVAKLLGKNDPLYEPLKAMSNRAITNWNGIEVGTTRAIVG